MSPGTGSWATAEPMTKSAIQGWQEDFIGLGGIRRTPRVRERENARTDGKLRPQRFFTPLLGDCEQ